MVPEDIINLELDDPNAYKKSYKGDFEDIELIDTITEILGSIENLSEKIRINVIIEKDNIFISHNSNSLDKDDIRRLLKIATHAMGENKKGISIHGVGWRGIADSSAMVKMLSLILKMVK